VVDSRRHAPSPRFGKFAAAARPRKVRHLYRGGSGRGSFRDMYGTDHTEPQIRGRYRWFISTCLAAAVGAIAIVVVIFGSADRHDASDGIMPTLKRITENTGAPPLEPMLRREDGLKWAVPRTDRLQVLTGAMSTRYIIHETLRQKRGGREYIYAKPYVRLVARLAPVPASDAGAIPPFNPFKLYADSNPIGSDGEGAQPESGRTDVATRVVELLGGILPQEDGQELDIAEVQELVAKAELADTSAALAASRLGEDKDALAPLGAAEAPEVNPNTTILAKSSGDTDDPVDSFEGLKRVVKTVGEGQKLMQILTDAGADTWQVREMFEAMKSVFPERQVAAGQEIHITLSPSLTRQNRMEPVRFSIFDAGQAHKVTVTRSNAGEFVASATPVDDDAAGRVNIGDKDDAQPSSLYASIYHANQVQSVPVDTIMRILRIHAYETDYRRRLRSGDACEFFFDLKDEGGTEGPPGELLFTSLTAGGESSRFYRFRTPDGAVDYYDAEGNNSKKFLMRKPLRADDVRLTSGFGLRFHPLLNEKRMHTGVDWASTPGTPVLAAGNGTIEEIGRKGHYGNYVRIRHANGYQTAYGHLSRFAEGAAVGVKVRQGQIIAFVGSTGLSSGPHLHFEVLVNNQFVDPLSIQVPRERKLDGKSLAEFQKERARIDDLMRRAPVMTASK
jgi:murein DD-endopeptidase MepM/ murein hydrolase activator NlpD